MAKMYNSISQNKNVCSVCQISEGLRKVINQEKEEPPLTGEVREACTASADRVANAILGEVLCEPARCCEAEVNFKIKITRYKRTL